jgi:hypothetical protein
VNPDLPVPYWPAYLPSPDEARCAPVPYRLTPLAETALAGPVPHPDPEPCAVLAVRATPAWPARRGTDLPRTGLQIRGRTMTMTASQPPRPDREGHPCPPWCAGRHSQPGYHAGPAIRAGDVLVSAVLDLHPATRRPPEVLITPAAPGARGLFLKPDDARALAAILAIPDEWDEVIALITAIRKAAADITNAPEDRP